MKNIALAVLIALFSQGCATTETNPTIRVFDDGAYGKFSESELATVSGCRGDGQYVELREIDGKKTRISWFEGSPSSIKIPPGKHYLKIIYFDTRFSLRPDEKRLIKTINIEVEKSHEYEVCIKVVYKGLLAKFMKGWVEDKTTGVKKSIL